MNKLKIEEYKYRLSHSTEKTGILSLVVSWILIWSIVNHFTYHNNNNILWKNNNVFKNPVSYALIFSWLWLFVITRKFIKSRKDDEWFEDYLIQREEKITNRKKKLQKSIQENIMHNFEEKLDEEISNIMDNNTPAEMEKARHNLFVLNMQMDCIEWKIDTIYKLQKRIKHLIRNKK